MIRISSFSFFVNLGQSKDDIIKCVVGLPEQSPQKSFIIINTLRFISMLLIQYLIMNNNRVLMREVLYVFMKTTLNLNKYRWHWLQLEKVLVPACAPCYLAWYFGICTFIVKYFIRQICRHLHFFGPGGLFLWVLIVLRLNSETYSSLECIRQYACDSLK